MRTKIIALIMILPLVAALVLLSVSVAISVKIDIPAQSISITTPTDNGILYVNYANRDDLKLNAEVLPINAKNREYYYKIEEVEGSDFSNIALSEDGALSIKSLGAAKVTAVSKDGGYTDSIIVSVHSSKAINFTPMIKNALGEVSPLVSARVGDDEYFMSIDSDVKQSYIISKAYPSTFSDVDIKYESDNPDVCSINEVTGQLTPLFGGTANITATMMNGADGDVVKTIHVTVERAELKDGILVNGMHGDLVLSKGETSTVLYVETQLDSIPVVTVNSSGISYVIKKEDEKKYKLTLSFSRDLDIEETSVLLKLGNNDVYTQKIIFTDFSFNVYTSYHLSIDNEIFQKCNTEVTYTVVSDFRMDDIEFLWTVEDNNILSTQTDNIKLISKSLSIGNTRMIVRAMKEGEELFRVEKMITTVYGVASMIFEESAKNYGIGKILAIGDTKIESNKYVVDLSKLSLKMYTNTGEKIDIDDLKYESTDLDIANLEKTNDSICVRIENDGEVVLKAKWLYADYFNESVSSTIRVKCVKDGVKVDDYNSLKKATEDKKRVVLTSSIMLGKEKATLEELVSMSKEMETTYDWRLYYNKSEPRPMVKYLIEFKNDLYGNGYEINADYITQAKDATSLPLLFRGPLDFVSIANAAVKAQDNIVFLVRENGITIDNAILKGCSDESITDGDAIDLSKLNNTGTTLEINASTNIINCRVSNGRTAIRIFGGKVSENGSPIVNDMSEINLKEEKIDVKIESCVISRAREFLVKIGSNRGVLATGETSSTFTPYVFTKENGTKYNQFENNLEDNYFVDNYLITDVTIKNCALTGSGLFAIGMETHFSGPMLNSAIEGTRVDYWENCAATSLATALRFEGDIMMAEWKNISNVDSSTLIEATNEASAFLKLNINAMLEAVTSKGGEKYADLITKEDEVSYVHGGVACYGGGYNYANIDFSKYNGEKPADYRINLSILANKDAEITDPINMQGTLLPLAAGSEDFRFLVYNSKSAFNNEKQRQMQLEGKLFDWIAAAK